MPMTKQERKVQLEALVRERESKKATLASLEQRAAAARERGDETEAARVEEQHARHKSVLKAAEKELANLGGQAKPKSSRAAKRG